jgi:small subunit ribosomal protein S4
MMSRYIGPRRRLIRKLGHLPGFTTKRLSKKIRNNKKTFKFNKFKNEKKYNQRFMPTNSRSQSLQGSNRTRPNQPNSSTSPNRPSVSNNLSLDNNNRDYNRNPKGKTRFFSRQKAILTPGQHGKKPYFFFKSRTPYGLRLLEKQKLRFNYHLSEKQLLRYVNQAKTKSQSTGLMLLRLLEMRLDNIVYRLGMAPTILAARQLVNHGHILVNQKKVTIPSYGCQANHIISVVSRPDCRKLISNRLANRPQKWRPPRHLQLNRKNLVGVVKKAASRKVVQLRINELLVIEYYSGK